MIGCILLVGSIFLDFLVQDIISNYVIFLLAGVVLCGAIITFFGLYNFPVFFELTQWKENLIQLYIFERIHFKMLFSFYFSKINLASKSPNNLNTSEDEKQFLFSRGMIGIDQIITGLTKLNEEKINKIKQAGILILLEYGNKKMSDITYALLVKKEMQSLYYFLKDIKKQFETTYKYFLVDLSVVQGNEEKLFSTFNNYIINFLK